MAEGRRSRGSRGRIFLVTSFMRVKEATPRRTGDYINPFRMLITWSARHLNSHLESSLSDSASLQIDSALGSTAVADHTLKWQFAQDFDYYGFAHPESRIPHLQFSAFPFIIAS